jgi:tetratricopeptide (TPR) repeat protein
MFGDLLIDMGEYAKAETYFDTIFHREVPNDEEVGLIYYYFGCVHRLQGDLARAATCYDRAYNFHMNARPKRRAGAGKALNGLGVVYSQQSEILKAEKSFNGALALFKKSLPNKHIDVAATLINLGTIDCDQRRVRLENFLFLIFFQNIFIGVLFSMKKL